MTSAVRFAPLALVLASHAAFADRPGGLCINVNAKFTPSDALQIVAWVEDAAGNYIDTIYVTSKVGRYGLGNRPGRFDFNSGEPTHDSWPYGRRVTTFPVWSHRHGLTFPQVVFQNGDDNNLSHPFDQSSPENQPPYCRPMMDTETGWDTGTCASKIFTDKGTFSSDMSLYPPRSDVTRDTKTDSLSVDMYKTLNVFDAVTQATPDAGTATQASWAAPQNIDLGDYVLWVEVGKEADMNSTYNKDTFPPPCPSCIPWADYGQPYRGQPSIVYSAPFTIATTATHASTMAYAGYGDPTGADGAIRSPDATITTDTPGSGASRLQLVADGSGMYRLAVDMTPEFDAVPPDVPDRLAPSAITGAGATLAFIAPGDDGSIGTVTGYNIKIRANSELTADNFDASTSVTATIAPNPAGQGQTFDLVGLLPETDYWVGVQAYDNCFNKGPIAIAKFTTADRAVGEVNACFVATAAYGSILANEVEMLRHFRDSLLQTNVLGELAVETYYTFGPAVAGMVGESELLRHTARDVLAPIVAWVRGLSF